MAENNTLFIKNWCEQNNTLLKDNVIKNETDGTFCTKHVGLLSSVVGDTNLVDNVGY